MKKILPSVLIFIFTFIIWKPVLNQALIGEGPIYFNPPYVTMLDTDPLKVLWSRHDSQALLFFQIAGYTFKDNMKLYMLFLIIGASFVSICLYFLIKKLTGSSITSSIAVIFFVTNYVGSYEILGLGYYQWFIQRVPNFGIAFLSLISLAVFFEKRRKFLYYLAVILYTIAVFLARYTILILPLFIFYIIFVNTFDPKKNNKKLFLVLCTSIPFIVVTYILYKAQSLVTGSAEITSIRQLLAIIPNVFYQTTYLTFPFLKSFSRYISNPITTITIPLIFIYIISTLFVIKKDKTKNKSLSAITLSIALSIPLSILISIVLNPVFLPYYDSSRYLYYTSLLTSSFWGIIIWQLIKLKKIIFLPVCLIIIVLWVIYNINILNYNFQNWDDKFPPVLKTFNYMKINISNVKPNSLIIVPANLGNYGSGMLKYFYGENNINYMPFDKDTNFDKSAPRGTKQIIYLYKNI